MIDYMRTRLAARRPSVHLTGLYDVMRQDLGAQLWRRLATPDRVQPSPLTSPPASDSFSLPLDLVTPSPTRHAGTCKLHY